MERIKRTLSHPFLGDSVVYFGTSALNNVLAYLYIILVSHILSKESFGRFNALLAGVSVCSVFAGALSVYITREVAHSRGADLEQFWRRQSRRLMRYSVLGLAGSLVLEPFIGGFLGASLFEVLISYLTLVSMFFWCLANGVLGGLKRMRLQGGYNLAGGAVKLAFGAACMLLGTQIVGAFSGYISSCVLVFLVTHHFLDKLIARAQAERGQDEPTTAELVRLSPWTIGLIYLLVALPFGFDQVLVQGISRANSGDYGALATLGKMVFFSSLPICQVLYSYLANCRGARERERRYLAAGGAGAVLCAAFVLVFFMLYGPLFVRILLPPQYGSVVAFLVPYAAGLVLYTFSYALVLFFVVRGNLLVFVPLVLSSLVQLALFVFRHERLVDLVHNQVWTFSCQALLLAALFFVTETVRHEG